MLVRAQAASNWMSEASLRLSSSTKEGRTPDCKTCWTGGCLSTDRILRIARTASSSNLASPQRISTANLVGPAIQTLDEQHVNSLKLAHMNPYRGRSSTRAALFVSDCWSVPGSELPSCGRSSDIKRLLARFSSRFCFLISTEASSRLRLQVSLSMACDP